MIDITKPVRTNLGSLVTELNWCAGKIVGNLNGGLFVWEADGSAPGFGFTPPIENVPEPRLVWMNVFANPRLGFDLPRTTRLLADTPALGCDRLHVLRINLDTGECVKEPV